MASPQGRPSSHSTPPSLGSYQTALCIIPPAHICTEIDGLRAKHDKNFGKWPPHLNLVYPFVAPEALPLATDLIRTHLAARTSLTDLNDLHLRLDKSGFFSHRNSCTVFITASGGSPALSFLHELRNVTTQPFGQYEKDFTPHLSIGQSQGSDETLREYLLSKAALLPVVEWAVEELVVLIRDHSNEGQNHTSAMRVWGTIDINGSAVSQIPRPVAACRMAGLEDPNPSHDHSYQSHSSQQVKRGVTYQFDQTNGLWVPYARPSGIKHSHDDMRSTLSVSSYNVLVGAVYPPEPERYGVLLHNILSDAALADVLVLQEVSDPFLSYLLGDHDIQRRYPYTSHAAPNQANIGPLESMRNLVVLSGQAFSWDWLPLQRRHKGALIVSMENAVTDDGSTFLPVILAAVHLTCGLSDSAVAAKRSQLRSTISHLERNYARNSWLVAGDFNLATSGMTLDVTAKTNSNAPATIAQIESMLSDAKLADTWYAARAQGGTGNRSLSDHPELGPEYDGEDGATFDPLRNPLAAAAVSGGLSNRPQRYDRILIRATDLLKPVEHGLFGLPYKHEDHEKSSPLAYGSDHWGIRARFRVKTVDMQGSECATKAHQPAILDLQKAHPSVSSVTDLRAFLTQHDMFPTANDSIIREEAVVLLREVLQQHASQPGATEAIVKSHVAVNVTAVGSYGFGVWTPSSDIDCLCVGNISTKTFFAIAQQKLRRAAAEGVRIVRRVAAASGKMLELDVRGVRVELHYCAASRIAESWPNALSLPSTDPVFDLPLQSLTKLQPLRDLDQLRHTIPDLTAFRLAHRLLKLWAMRRGIYASRFGYLGGIHITLLLARICKLLYREAGAATANDLVRTFFSHYAHFEWANEAVYDPFFHPKKPWYYRTAREPMVILTLHRPSINVARTASVPSVRTIVAELQRADRILSSGVPPPCWPELINGHQHLSSTDFKASYANFVKIELHYWGPSASRRVKFLSWVESRCALLLVDIGRKLPKVHARIWPARFRPTLNDAATATTKESREVAPQDYQGCYLVGLGKPTEHLILSKVKMAESALFTAMQDFAAQIRSDEKYYDPQTTWVDVSLTNREQVMELELDEGAGAAKMFAEGDDDESEDELDDLEDANEANLIGSDSEPPLHKADAVLRSPTRRGGSASPCQPCAKLRPAADVLNRLRWDSALDSADYLIGWEDRFVGVRETPLLAWKLETTDEEFVPLHRVLYFRRKSDGGKVWDREARVDTLFHSGVSAATTEEGPLV